LPVAVNCTFVFTGAEGSAGEIEMDRRFAAAELTLSRAVPVTEPDLAVIVTAPELDPVAWPEESTLAMAESDELHWAVLVTS